MQRRRLAAIMFTDIVGYTALMGRDEDQAFEILRINKEIHTKLIEKYHGTLIKEMGDGILVSFESSSDSVRCALEIQAECKKKEVPLKIGIHEGEMVFEGDDVHGDGVNIASRLQAVTETGAITISEAIYRNVKNKPGIYTAFLEEKQLKNVDDPVKIYLVSDQEITIEVRKPEKVSKLSRKKGMYALLVTGLILVIAIVLWKFFPSNQQNVKTLNASIGKSIAVLPFRNDSPDPDNEYFCNGMMEDILTNLQKIGELNVKSRTDVEQYRETTKTIAEIGNELGVAFILEGSVRKIDDNLRITAQLIDVNTGNHLWADNYNGKYTEEIFDYQINTAKSVATALHTAITPEEEERIDKIPEVDIATYDLVLQARDAIRNFWIGWDQKYLILGRKLIDRALEMHPEYLQAIAIKGYLYRAEFKHDSVYLFAKKVLAIDPESAPGYDLMGSYYSSRGEIDSAIHYSEMALKHFKPGDLVDKKQIETWLGSNYCCSKLDYLKGLPYFQRVLDIEPDPPVNLYMRLTWVFLNIGDYERAEMYNNKIYEYFAEYWTCYYLKTQTRILRAQGKFNQSINFLDSICPQFTNRLPEKRDLICELHCLANLFRAHLQAGNLDQAEQQYKILLQEYPNWGEDWNNNFDLAYLHKKMGRKQEAYVLLNRYRINNEEYLSKNIVHDPLINLAMTHALLDEKEKSLKYLSDAIAFGQGSAMNSSFEIDHKFENLWDDPEFKALMKLNREKIKTAQKQINRMRERGEISF